MNPLPLKAIDRLFERLSATYGTDFSNRFTGLSIASAKSVWAHELAGFSDKLECIAWALENLPERAPNIIEFRNLCRRSPTTEPQRIEAPKADPARVAAELEKLGHLRAAPRQSSSHGKQWAFTIMARHEAGERIGAYALKCAQEVVAKERAIQGVA